MNIRLKILRNGLNTPYQAHENEWIDLRAADEQYFKRGDFGMIHLGVAMELPEGYEAFLVPRSSTFKNYGLIQTNGIGVIDHAYCGDRDEWSMPVYATRDCTVHKNDRVCQFRLQKVQENIDFTFVESLGNKDRGGFGSTGSK